LGISTQDSGLWLWPARCPARAHLDIHSTWQAGDTLGITSSVWTGLRRAVHSKLHKYLHKFEHGESSLALEWRTVAPSESTERDYATGDGQSRLSVPEDM
ncbi:hypothetical protein THAOC_23111, partial [Thalassiosira oceanica]